MINYINLLKLLGFEIQSISPTADSSIIVRIKNSDCFLDFYETGEVIVVYKIGDVKYFCEFEIGDFEKIKELIKDKFK